MNKLMIYALTKEQAAIKNEKGKLIAEYDGVSFKNEDVLIKQEEAGVYETIRIYSGDYWTYQIPRRFTKNIRNKIKREYIRIYGEANQLGMF